MVEKTQKILDALDLIWIWLDGKKRHAANLVSVAWILADQVGLEGRAMDLLLLAVMGLQALGWGHALKKRHVPKVYVE